MKNFLYNPLLRLSYFSFFSFALFACSPDITGTVRSPAQALPGEKLSTNLQVSLKNSGSEVADSFFIDLVLSSDSIIPIRFAEYSPNFREDVLLEGGREHIKSLAVGASISPKLNGPNKIPEDTPPGIYFLGLVADPGNSVDESNESNNISLSKIEVLSCSPIANINDCQIIEASGGTVGFAKLLLRWAYGNGEKPSRLLIKVFRYSADDWLNIMPNGEPFEVPSPQSTLESEVIIFRLFSGNYKLELEAFYSCNRKELYIFEDQL